ncbi:hypothetical protein F4781DRAFT_406752 [Annulohypoxylon bovei var. microspora]|nr:hypothetical protein F4781DRAFT_406752 [Annulohypoxylon bovei var. microspora]
MAYRAYMAYLHVPCLLSTAVYLHNSPTLYFTIPTLPIIITLCCTRHTYVCDATMHHPASQERHAPKKDIHTEIAFNPPRHTCTHKHTVHT